MYNCFKKIDTKPRPAHMQHDNYLAISDNDIHFIKDWKGSIDGLLQKKGKIHRGGECGRKKLRYWEEESAGEEKGGAVVWTEVAETEGGVKQRLMQKSKLK